ncbi:MAG: EF-hand domain-containing protein [Vicinamibacterales bacterium]
MLSPFVRRKVALAFYRFDLTRNGLVSQDDLRTLGRRVAQQLNLPEYTIKHDKIVDAFLSLWASYGKAADANGDNAITLDEYLDAHEKFAQLPNSQDIGLQTNAVTFDAIDVDGDGKIGEREYVLFLKAQGVSANDAHEAFHHLDRDGDDVITREELAADWWEYWNSDDQAAPGNWFYGSF